MEITRPASKQSIPEDAKKVFKGILFDVYQWEVKGYDGSVKIFEKVKRPDTVGIIPVTEDGKIILSFEEQPGRDPFLGIIGGRIDEGEDILEAAKRELREETGHEAKEWILFDTIQPVSKLEWAIYTFIAKGCRKVGGQNLDGAEKIEPRLVGFDEFVDILSGEGFGERECRMKILEAKADPAKMAALKELILGSL